MIPFRDVVPSRTTPMVTLGLIAFNAGVFLIVPAELSWWHPVTSLFLHDGWIHLISNIWALWLFGDNVESRLGHWRYLLVYCLTAAASAMVQVWASPSPVLPVIGLSGPGGAIAGVVGGYFVLYPRSRILVFVPRFFSIDLVEVPAVGFAGIWLATQLFLSLGRMGDPATGSGVMLMAYAGGLGAGMALVWLLGRRRDTRWWEEF